jgi:2-polyprenyl-6-methoxyphenol hydroxylase-like FAD-dependent oxidoreductase
VDVVADVIVVGGGPVGLAAAIEARLAGLSVTLIEQRSGTIDKACGEGLMPGAVPLLARLGVDPAGEALRGVVYRQGELRAEHRFGSGTRASDRSDSRVRAGRGASATETAGRGVRRTELHRALAARVDGLGVTRITAKVTGLNSGATVAVVRASGPDGEVTLLGRYVLGCDGLHSTVARLAGLRASEPAPSRWSRLATSTRRALIASRRRDTVASRRLDRGTASRETASRQATSRTTASRRYGVRQHYAVAPWSDNIEVYYAGAAEFYVTPVAPDTVGLAMLARRGTDFDAALATIPELAARLEGVAAASARRGAGPFQQRTRARTSGRVLLVGDASGYVDAITGEGLRLGFAQARAAVRCITEDSPRGYERQWKRETRDFRVLTSGLVLLATSPARRAIVPLAVRFPALFGVVVERLAR